MCNSEQSNKLNLAIIMGVVLPCSPALSAKYIMDLTVPGTELVPRTIKCIFKCFKRKDIKEKCLQKTDPSLETEVDFIPSIMNQFRFSLTFFIPERSVKLSSKPIRERGHGKKEC